MTDKDFGRKPKFGPVSKKGPPKPPPKNRKSRGDRPVAPTVRSAVPTGLPGQKRLQMLLEEPPANLLARRVSGQVVVLGRVLHQIV